MSFGTEGKTATGTSPIDAAMYLEQMGASAVGSNCSVGSSPMIKMIAEMSSKVTIPIIAQPNAGFPTQEGGRTVYRSSPNYMAQQALRLIENGATIQVEHVSVSRCHRVIGGHCAWCESVRQKIGTPRH